MARQSVPYRDYRYQQRRDWDRGRVAPRVYTPRYYAPRYCAPRYRAIVPYRPHFFGRPYYVFRPRLSVGFGLWLGFGVPYPRAWVAGYPPPVYGYYNGGFGVVPNAASCGGLSFDITPDDAAIFVDGQYIGRAGDFAPSAALLTLVPGRLAAALLTGDARGADGRVRPAAFRTRLPFLACSNV